MTDTIALLETRRSVPPVGLGGPGPTQQELQKLLTLAARVPDHGKLAPWRFIVFEGKARERAGEEIARVFAIDTPDAGEERLAIERKRLAHAPLVIAVVSRAAPHVKIPEWEQVLSAGAVCMTLTVAANAMGFATTWITEWYAYDRRVLDALGLAPHEKIAGFVHIGRSASRPEDRVRPIMAEIVTHFA
jgi:nitroreductase